MAQSASPGIVDLDVSNSNNTNKVIIITKEESLWFETLVEPNDHILVWMIILLFQILHENELFVQPLALLVHFDAMFSFIAHKFMMVK